VPIRDELIERAVRQLAAAFAKLLASRHGASVTNAEVVQTRAQLDEIYRQFVGTSAALVGRLSTDDLLRVLGSAGYVDGERAYLLSALLETEAELSDAAGSAGSTQDAQTLRARALDLALEAGIEELGEPDLVERVEGLEGQLPVEDRTPATWERLVWFWRAQERWSKAEDAVFAWLDEVEAGAAGGHALRDVSEKLYGHLENLDDALLEKGGLPRDELTESRAELAARFGVMGSAGP